jgi:tetratricopeptide (TPR) repeat protein
MKVKTSKGKNESQGDAKQDDSKPKGALDLRLPRIVMSPGFTKVLIALLLIAVCACAVSYKVYLLNKLPFFDPGSGEAFFWTESAFHFRHFQMVAQGDGIPAVDSGIQHPEGLNTVRYITPVMEQVAGRLYRWFFSDMAPHVFLVHFSIVISTLSILAIFFTARAAWRSRVAAFICACFYALAPASLIRTSGGGFIREDFALPFIFFSFGCFIACLHKDKPLVSGLGSGLLIIALSAWHVTQLYLSLFVAALVVAYFLKNDQDLPLRSLAVFVVMMISAALFIPVLRAKHFIFSPALMLSCGLLVIAWLSLTKKRNHKERLVIAGFILCGFLVTSLIIQTAMGTYSHVYELLLAKVRFLGVLPQDPGRLSFEAKSMWTSAFVSPQLAELPFLLSATLIFGPLAVGILIQRMLRRQISAHEIVIAFLTGCMFILFLMIHRMSVFAIFFLALSMGTLTQVNNISVKRAVYASLALCFLIQCYLLPSFKLVAFRPNQKDLKSVLAFIKTRTAPETAVLTTFQLGPAVAAYTAHPVTLHSKFESKILRDKVARVYAALYRSEDAFYEVCKKLKVGLFVYQPDMVQSGAPGSIRYLVGAIPLKTDSAAFSFHFAPQKLKHFTLLYQNPIYRVYGVGKQETTAAASIQYEPHYDLANFLDNKKPGEILEDTVLMSGLEKLRTADMHIKIATRFFVAQDYDTAARQYERAMRIDPKKAQAAWGLVRSLVRTGERERLRPVVKWAVSIDPNYDATQLDLKDVDLWVELASDALGRKDYENARRMFQKAVDLEPSSEKANFGLGSTLMTLKRYKDAESAYQRVVASNPRNHQAYEYLGKIYANWGDTQNAVAYVEKSLSIRPNQVQLQQVYDHLRAQLQKKQKVNANFDFYFKSGIQEAKKGDLEVAKEMFLKAAELKRNASVMYNLGLLSHRMQNEDDAIYYLQQAVALDADSIDARSLLRYILSNQNLKLKIGKPQMQAQGE